jgi:large subunit ribosomal protein L18
MKIRVIKRKDNRERRRLKIREKIKGTEKKPRLSVFRSVKYTYAQLVDDRAGKTLVDVSDAVKEISKKGTKSEASYEVGKLLAERAAKKGIKEAVFDRGGYKYHGRVKKLAEGARDGGLKF